MSEEFCLHCGHIWNYKGKRKIIECPDCGRSYTKPKPNIKKNIYERDVLCEHCGNFWHSKSKHHGRVQCSNVECRKWIKFPPLTPEEDIVLTPDQERIFLSLKEQWKDNLRLRKYSLRFWKEKVSKLGGKKMSKVLDDNDMNEILGNNWFYQKMEDGEVVVKFTSKITSREPGKLYGAEAIINGIPGKYSFGNVDNWLIKKMVNAMKKYGIKNEDLPGTVWSITMIAEYNDNVEDWQIICYVPLL